MSIRPTEVRFDRTITDPNHAATLGEVDDPSGPDQERAAALYEEPKRPPDRHPFLASTRELSIVPLRWSRLQHFSARLSALGQPHLRLRETGGRAGPLVRGLTP